MHIHPLLEDLSEAYSTDMVWKAERHLALGIVHEGVMFAGFMVSICWAHTVTTDMEVQM